MPADGTSAASSPMRGFGTAPYWQLANDFNTGHLILFKRISQKIRQYLCVDP